ncbi:hypothetical protein SAMN02745130_03146 [Thiothrix eikelboomii]|uniref:Aminotransferase class-III n=1 Tax=Thiothrix eikelboomii TaxID=92487 RepID=A0A1T4XLL0_9GAMM|nr:hypothetical protein [Thiothrix eikelboomii]SKA90427.1 hypothetical protein SAMN02745130_03146 [Thiothrix eikelboomii]
MSAELDKVAQDCPADAIANPAKIFVKAEGVEITDNQGHTVLDAASGLWNVIA